MYYYIKNVEKSITLAPKDIGMKITDIIFDRFPISLLKALKMNYKKALHAS